MKNTKKSTSKSAKKQNSASKSAEKKMNLKDLLIKQMQQQTNMHQSSKLRQKQKQKISINQLYEKIQHQTDAHILTILLNNNLKSNEINGKLQQKNQISVVLKKIYHIHDKQNTNINDKVICLNWIQSIASYCQKNNLSLPQLPKITINDEKLSVLLETIGKIQLLIQ